MKLSETKELTKFIIRNNAIRKIFFGLFCEKTYQFLLHLQTLNTGLVFYGKQANKNSKIKNKLNFFLKIYAL